jgi:hypothetical protein
MIAMAKGPRGEQSVLVNSLKNSIVRDLQPKDYLGELLAIRNFAVEYIRYSNDALGVEQVQDPERISQQIVQYNRAVGDCDDLALWIGTLCRQLGRDTQFVIVGFGRPGHYSHVFARAKEPKSGQWIVLDPVAGTNEGSMLRRVTTYQIYPID